MDQRRLIFTWYGNVSQENKYFMDITRFRLLLFSVMGVAFAEHPYRKNLMVASPRTYVHSYVRTYGLGLGTSSSLSLIWSPSYAKSNAIFSVDFHLKCENPHIAIVQFSRLGGQFP